MKFRKKPIVIEAVQWTGGNEMEMRHHMGRPECQTEPGVFSIHTLEGVMRVAIGDWIIRGVNGEYYPCKPDIFEKTYEPVTVVDKTEWTGK